MIYGKEEVFWRVCHHCLYPPTDKLLEAIRCALRESAERCLVGQDHVDIAFSGGLDSSICAAILKEMGIPIVLHTMTDCQEHPDAVYATMFAKTFDISHKLYIGRPSDAQKEGSIYLLGCFDNYWFLMHSLSKAGVYHVICCDIIDELLCGYYSHQPDGHTFQHHLDRLIPDHLDVLDKCSTHFGINVELPYGHPDVMDAAAAFALSDLVDDSNRKKPLYAVGKKIGLPERILTRRKMGLVSAIECQGK